MLVDECRNLTAVTGTDLVADQRTTGCGKGGDRHKGYARYAAYDIGYSKRTFSQVFDKDKEQEPRRKRNEVLYHGPYRDVHDLRQLAGTEARDVIQSVLAEINFLIRVYDEEQHRYQFGKRRTDGSSGNTHGRKAELTEIRV